MDGVGGFGGNSGKGVRLAFSAVVTSTELADAAMLEAESAPAVSAIALVFDGLGTLAGQRPLCISDARDRPAASALEE